MARAPLPSGTVLGPVLLSAVGKDEPVFLHFRPGEAGNLASAAAREQQEADDVGLLHAVLPAGMSVERGMETADLLAGQEAGELRAPVVNAVAEAGLLWICPQATAKFRICRRRPRT